MISDESPPGGPVDVAVQVMEWKRRAVQAEAEREQAYRLYHEACSERNRAEVERDGWRDLVRGLMDDPNEKGCPPVSDGWIHRPHQPASDNTYCERCGEAWPCPNERARAALFGDESGGES